MQPRTGSFTYNSYSFTHHNSDLYLKYTYSIHNQEESEFSHYIHIPSKSPYVDEVAQRLIFLIGLAEAINYWKITAAPTIKIQAGDLSPEEIEFWNWVFTFGMCEFHYNNNLDFSINDFIVFKTSSPKKLTQASSHKLQGELILSGGGKDSSVTLELLKNHSKHQAAFVLETNSPIKSAHNIAMIKEYPILKAKRTLDQQLFALNKLGALNGHIPFSLILALIATLTAYQNSFKYVIASNESSANEPTLIWNGLEINHQIAKSYIMEQKLSQYFKNQIPNIPQYFSFLRPISELQIAAIFSQIPVYHHHAISCNKGQKENRWCESCPKCAFSYAMFFPFIQPQSLKKMFTHDLFEDEDIISHLKDNIGLTNKKPFECVGTKQETIDALILSREKYISNQLTIPISFQKLYYQIPTQNLKSPAIISQELKNSWTTAHNLPNEYTDILSKRITAL